MALPKTRLPKHDLPVHSKLALRALWRFPMDPFSEISPGVLGNSLAAQNREPRTAHFPESGPWNGQKFSSEKQKDESNRTRTESRKINSESPSESHPNNA